MFTEDTYQEGIISNSGVLLKQMVEEVNNITAEGEDVYATIEIFDDDIGTILKEQEVFFSGFESDIDDTNILWFHGIEFLNNPIKIKIHKLGITDIFRNLDNHLYVLRLKGGLAINIDLAY